jgi:hypothetical protein
MIRVRAAASRLPLLQRLRPLSGKAADSGGEVVSKTTDDAIELPQPTNARGEVRND